MNDIPSWLADSGGLVADNLKNAVREADGAEPANGEVSGQKYQDARGFIETVEAAADLIEHAAGLAEDGKQREAKGEYDYAYRTLTDEVSYSPPQSLPETWKYKLDDAVTEVKSLLEDLPKP